MVLILICIALTVVAIRSFVHIRGTDDRRASCTFTGQVAVYAGEAPFWIPLSCGAVVFLGLALAVHFRQTRIYLTLLFLVSIFGVHRMSARSFEASEMLRLAVRQASDPKYVLTLTFDVISGKGGCRLNWHRWGMANYPYVAEAFDSEPRDYLRWWHPYNELRYPWEPTSPRQNLLNRMGFYYSAGVLSTPSEAPFINYGMTVVAPYWFYEFVLSIFPTLLLTTVAARLIRRYRRGRRQLCSNCGYDLRSGHSVCPECGFNISLPSQ